MICAGEGNAEGAGPGTPDMRATLAHGLGMRLGNGAIGGDEGIRTPDILLAKQALYQLSYVPVPPVFGSGGDFSASPRLL